MNKKKVVIANDLGGTNLRMATICGDGEILNRLRYPTPRSGSPQVLVDTITKMFEKIKSDTNNCEIVSFAVAVPGIVDTNKGLIYKSPNLPELNGFEIVNALEKSLSTTVILENDANAAAVGENWIGASKGFQNSIMVTLGTGIGGGIIIDNKVLRGIDGTAGEIGHINVEPDGHKCGCGSHGCVEQYASATAVVRMARELANEESFKEVIEPKHLSSEDVYQLALDGNDLAKKIFHKQGFYLGIMLAGLINSLNPEVISIGGGAAAGWELFIPHLKEQIKVRSYREPAERVNIVKAKLGDDAGILGVAKLGFDTM